MSAQPTKPLPAAQIAAMAKPDPSGPDRVALSVPVVMCTQLEQLTARAIREGKALRGLINELLAAAADRESG